MTIFKIVLMIVLAIIWFGVLGYNLWFRKRKISQRCTVCQKHNRFLKKSDTAISPNHRNLHKDLCDGCYIESLTKAADAQAIANAKVQAEMNLKIAEVVQMTKDLELKRLASLGTNEIMRQFTPQEPEPEIPLTPSEKRQMVRDLLEIEGTSIRLSRSARRTT